MAETRKRAIAYLRVSTAKQAEEGLSLQAQEERLAAMAKAEGWDLLEIVTDAESGGKRRENLEAIFADLERFDVLLIDKVNRFGRRFSHSVQLKEVLDDNGKLLYCREPRMNYSDTNGKFMWNILSTFAEHERAEIGERVAATSAQHRRAGKPAGGRPPYGYQRLEAQGPFTPDPAKAPVVLRIYDDYVSGMAMLGIQKALNADRIPSPSGGRWGHKSIQRILCDPKYKGAQTHLGQIVASDAHPAIVPEPLWRKVESLRAARDRAPGAGRGRRPERSHLFIQGHLHCGICGGHFIARTHNKLGPAYMCRNHTEEGTCPQKPIPAKGIDQHAWRYFERWHVDQEATRRDLDARAAMALKQAQGLRAGADREVTRLTTEVDRINRAFRNGNIGEDRFEPMVTEAETELQAAKAEAQRLLRRESEVEAADHKTDREAVYIQAMQELQAVAAGDVSDPAVLKMQRAALQTVFDHFVYHEIDEGPIPLADGNALPGFVVGHFTEGDRSLTSCYEPPQTRVPLQLSGSGSQGSHGFENRSTCLRIEEKSSISALAQNFEVGSSYSASKTALLALMKGL
jgi:site-specific DNA recombinase